MHDNRYIGYFRAFSHPIHTRSCTCIDWIIAALDARAVYLPSSPVVGGGDGPRSIVRWAGHTHLAWARSAPVPSKAQGQQSCPTLCRGMCCPL